MKVLLLHPDDLPDAGDWSRESWDLVVDLGFAGPEIYAGWSRLLRNRVLSIHQFARHPESYRWVNEVLERGRGRLLDRMGLDWWEILAMERYQDLRTLYLFRQLQRELGGDPVDLTATRPHRFSRIAEQVFDVAIDCFQTSSAGPMQKVKRALHSARNLRTSQLVEIAFDKWDPSYQFRRHLRTYSRARLSDPCVLLPSAYSNVTRSVLAYASRLPRRKFLLIATRRNAIPGTAPNNVTVGSLSAYVQSAKKTREEATALQMAWKTFSDTLQNEDEQFRCSARAGVWDYFRACLQQGLRLREAWSCVLQSEPVSGVLCGDDLNYYTRLPLLLAQRKGLNAVYCSHGALDGGFLFKAPSADTYLVKGDMERDYLERAASLERERVIVAAPGRRRSIASEGRTSEGIVFFSQPYEIDGGRAASIYREIVPRLHSAARSNGRKLIIKLHPFESRRARQALVNSALGGAGTRDVEIVEGGSPGHTMSRAWCGVTVDSSVAVECALNEIPFFLCGWLDLTGIGYLGQFAKFGVAHVLNAPEDIERIPQLVADFNPDPEKLERLWHEADPTQLDEVMFGARQARTTPCVC